MISRTRLPMRMVALLIDVFGLKLKDLIGEDERIRQVRATATIGMVVGAMFAVFNLFTQGMLALGLTELAAVVLLLIPAAVISRKTGLIGLAEGMILAACLVILMALIIFGGIAGTGLFWVYTAPFLIFFLLGQRRGWLCSLGFLAIVSMYFMWVAPMLDFAFRFSQEQATHFMLSLGFYTLVAAAFNQLRSRFEEQLQLRVDEKTADAKALLGQLQFLATHDTVTKLPNRVLMLEMLKTEISAVQATGQSLLICNIHLERYFELSNILGAAGTDQMMNQVAAQLSAISNENGLLAHTQLDEFVIVRRLEGKFINTEKLSSFIEERQFSLEVHGYSLFIELTLGFASYPAHSDTPQALLIKAAQAMLQARKQGQHWSIYDAKLEQLFVSHHLLFGKLREAISKQHLQVYYQPQVDLRTGRVVGAEALSRWLDPVSGMVPPISFIPVAEESGLIRPLTTWLIGESLRECAKWHAMGLALEISINLSARNLMDPELLSVMSKALADTGMKPEFVTMEITESCFMTSPDRAMEVIAHIHDSGFKLSIDDFGTGFSSLAYLKNLPIDELKIDQGFVFQLLTSGGDQAIVSSTIDLAHNFKLSVVAEGVETEEAANWLRARGCDVGQGYLFAKPLPAKDFVKFVQSRNAPFEKA